MNYNQNDSVYGSIMLGFSKKYTLKSSGCYVFALAHLLEIDPLICNETLKSANAFMADETGDICLLNHSKIALAFPTKVLSVSKYDSYDNDACLEAITNNGGCIVKVQNGSSTHFVEFIGNKKLFDSLGGIEKPTSTYPTLLGLRVINLKKNVQTDSSYKGYDLSNPDSMRVAVDCLVDLQNGQLVRKADVDQITKDLNQKLVDQATAYEKEKAIKDEQIKALEESLQKLQDTEHTWQDQADVYQRKLKAIVEEFSKVGVSVAVESDEGTLVNSIHNYLSTIEKLQSDNKQLNVDLSNASKTVDGLNKVIVDLKNKLKLKDTSFKTINLGSFIIKFYKS